METKNYLLPCPQCRLGRIPFSLNITENIITRYAYTQYPGCPSCSAGFSTYVGQTLASLHGKGLKQAERTIQKLIKQILNERPEDPTHESRSITQVQNHSRWFRGGPKVVGFECKKCTKIINFGSIDDNTQIENEITCPECQHENTITSQDIITL